MSTSEQIDASTLTCLRKAAKVGPLPLQEKGSVTGIFPAAAKGKPLAERAKEHGWIAEKRETRTTTKTVRGKSKTTTAEVVVGWELTPAGHKYLAEHDNPKAALETLIGLVQKFTPSDNHRHVPDPTVFSTAIEKATETCLSTIRDAFTDLQQKVLQAVTPTNASSDPAPVLAALRAAADRVKIPDMPAFSPPPPPPVPSHTATSAIASTEGEIVAYVQDRVKRTSVGCQFDELMNHLRTQNPNLTVGAFHDALRKLHDSDRIRLGGWPRMLDDMPEPELALFVSSKVMYYAQPAH